MTAKRIRKNAHKKIAAIFSNSTTAKAYAEDNGFVGVDVAIEWVKKMAVGRSVEYYDNQDGSYTIRIHSNLWYELYQSNYEVRKKIRESEEPIPVRGIFHKPKKEGKELASLEELNGILADVRAIQERILNLDVSENWEYKIKHDTYQAAFLLDLGVSDYILSIGDV